MAQVCTMEKKSKHVLKINCIPLKSENKIYESTLSVYSSQITNISIDKKETLKNSIKNFFKQKFSLINGQSKSVGKNLDQNPSNNEFVKEISEIVNSPNFDLIKQFLSLGVGPVGDGAPIQSLEQHFNQSIEAHIQRYLKKRQFCKKFLKDRKKFRIPKKLPVQDTNEQPIPFRVSDRIERFENLNNSINSIHSKPKEASDEFQAWSPKVIDYICKKNTKVKVNRKTSALSHSKSNTVNPSVSSYHSENKSEETLNAESLTSIIENKNLNDDVALWKEFCKKLKSDHIELMNHDEILEEKLILDRLLFKMDWNSNKGSNYDSLKKRYNILKLFLNGIKCSNCSHLIYFHQSL